MLDGYHLESMSHVLNGCKKFSNNYSKRHDRVVEKIAEELTTSDTKIYVNKLFSTTFPEFKEDQYITTQKLDIVIKTGNKILIIDVACPYDLYTENTYKHKINYYKCLKKILTEAGFEANVEAIIIGSLGTVHNEALNVLTNQNMNKRKAKGLLKWCSTSNIISAKQLWNRCRLVHD